MDHEAVGRKVLRSISTVSKQRQMKMHSTQISSYLACNHFLQPDFRRSFNGNW